MPNHIHSRIEITYGKERKHEILEILRRLGVFENNEYRLDFNKLIEMPKELSDTVAPTQVVKTQEEADRINQEREKKFNLREGQATIVAITEAEAKRRVDLYGANPGLHGDDPVINWYEWACKYWGTKWNAMTPWISSYDEAVGVQICFDTAWSPILRLFDMMIELFPEMDFTYLAEEEGLGFIILATYKAGSNLRESVRLNHTDEDYKIIEDAFKFKSSRGVNEDPKIAEMVIAECKRQEGES